MRIKYIYNNGYIFIKDKIKKKKKRAKLKVYLYSLTKIFFIKTIICFIK